MPKGIAGATAQNVFIGVMLARVPIQIVRLAEQRIAEGTGEALEKFAALIRALKQEVERSPAQLAELHTFVAALAVDAVIQAYERSVRQERNPLYNRRTNRMGEGALKRGLAKIATGDAEALHFMTAEALAELDSVAKQWARLNFGAGSVGDPANIRYPIDVFGRNVGSIGTQAQARPSFGLPAGVWLNGDGQAVLGGTAGAGDAFFPARSQSRSNGLQVFTPTRGIVARNFLQAGMEVIAAELGPAYQGLIASWMEQAGFRAPNFEAVIR